ncbi:uncharacterized protein METZ01_LOCUS435877, partial [marine metagenome]
ITESPEIRQPGSDIFTCEKRI